MGRFIILNQKSILVLLLLSFFTFNAFGKTNNYLKSTSLKNNQLKLTFKYNLNHVKYFTLKKKGIIKYIYDIKGAVLPKNINISHYKHRGVKAFRIGQFKKNYLRIVVESKLVTHKNYTVHGKVLTLNLPSTYRSCSVSKRPKKAPASSRKKVKKRYSPTIVIDAGHGGRDIGASYKRIIEKKITLKLALKLKKQLIRRGYKVYMTRSTDKHRSLKQRTDYANAKKANLFISLHTNAAPRRRSNYVYKGIEVYYLRSRTKRIRYRDRKIYTSPWKVKKSYQLCSHISNEMIKSVRKKHVVINKGVRRNNFWVLRGTKMPSILIESGYITDKYEGKRLTTNAYQNLLVRGMAKGVDKYFKR